LEKCLTLYANQMTKEDKVHKQTTDMKSDFIITKLLELKRHTVCPCSGSGGDSWTELEEDKEGELVKFEDIAKLISELKAKE
jgi:hypothetical protein